MPIKRIDTDYIRVIAEDYDEDGRPDTARDLRDCAKAIDALRRQCYAHGIGEPRA